MKKILFSLLICVQALAQTVALRSTGITPGTYGNATNVASITFDAQGYPSGVINIPISAGGTGTVTSFSATDGNGIDWTVTNPTTTPNLTASFQGIAPWSVTTTNLILTLAGNGVQLFGDTNTTFYFPAVGELGFKSSGTLAAKFNIAGNLLVGKAFDDNTGARIQTLSSGGPGLMEVYSYGNSVSFYGIAAAATNGATTPTTTAQVFRAGLRGYDTAGQTNNGSLGGNLEITPTGTWSGSDHGVTVALHSTPSGSTTRSAVLTIDGSQNTTIANTTKGAFQAAGTATSCTGATIGTGSKANAGFVTATTTGVSTVVVTFPFTATTGWVICPQNNTTATMIRQTASSTTTATFSGTTVSGDIISYMAMAY